MPEGVVASMEEKKELADLLGHVWNTVVRQINKLSEAHKQYEFANFKENLNPSLEEVIRAFEFIDFLLSKLVDSAQLGHDELKTALNTRQCILKMKELSTACDKGSVEDYERIIGDLNKQMV